MANLLNFFNISTQITSYLMAFGGLGFILFSTLKYLSKKYIDELLIIEKELREKENKKEIIRFEDLYKKENEKLNNEFTKQLESIKSENSKELEIIKANLQNELNEEKLKLDVLKSEFDIKLSYIHKDRVEKILLTYRYITNLNTAIEKLLNPFNANDEQDALLYKEIIKCFNEFVYFVNESKLYYSNKLWYEINPLIKTNKKIINMSENIKFHNYQYRIDIKKELENLCYPIINNLENEFRITLGIKD